MLEFNVRDVLREPAEDDEEVEAKEPSSTRSRRRCKRPGADCTGVRRRGDLDREVGGATEKGATGQGRGCERPARHHLGPSETPRYRWNRRGSTGRPVFVADRGLPRARTPVAGVAGAPVAVVQPHRFRAAPASVIRWIGTAAESWKLITTGASQASRDEEGARGARRWCGLLDQGRFVSGGLNAALQQQLFTCLKPALLPVKGKQYRARRPTSSRR